MGERNKKGVEMEMEAISWASPGRAEIGHPIGRPPLNLLVCRHLRTYQKGGGIMNKLLSAQEASEVLGCSVGLVRKLLRLGVIPRVKLGRLTRIRTSDVEKLMAQGTQPALVKRSGG